MFELSVSTETDCFPSFQTETVNVVRRSDWTAGVNEDYVTRVLMSFSSKQLLPPSFYLIKEHHLQQILWQDAAAARWQKEVVICAGIQGVRGRFFYVLFGKLTQALSGRFLLDSTIMIGFTVHWFSFLFHNIWWHRMRDHRRRLSACLIFSVGFIHFLGLWTLMFVVAVWIYMITLSAHVVKHTWVEGVRQCLGLSLMHLKYHWSNRNVL